MIMLIMKRGKEEKQRGEENDGRKVQKHGREGVRGGASPIINK